MIRMSCICVDAMGGDERPEVVLAGIEAALAESDDLSVLVVGDEDVVVPFCAHHERTRALVSTEVIAMDEHPTNAVRSKRDSSIVRGLAAVHTGEADGFFSAGSTGAIFAAASLGVGRTKGVKRACIATAVPGIMGRSTVFLDMGANADVRPDMMVQFAHMGRAYARTVLGVGDPTVALLSNGAEETKGSQAALAEHEALAAASGDAGWFVGNCEGTDLLAGRFDVIVTDGFSGNIALKSVEGCAKFIVSQLREIAASSPRYATGAWLLKPGLKGLVSKLSGDQYGGAMLLGLKAPVLIGHGATSPKAVKNGVLAAQRACAAKLVERLAAEVQAEP